MPAYIIVEIDITDPVRYDRYRQLAAPTIPLYDGRYLARGGPTEPLEGTWQPKRLVILEFPNSDRARAWWSSPEYAPAKALRYECARSEMLLVEGLPSGVTA
ncbi:MAG TPA: DUF1330 domain-containing protein [Gemmatimonadaceae bacterium]|nr:DUF1330 domain-containing protein [Gemmatimonadaceae bacterium]